MLLVIGGGYKSLYNYNTLECADHALAHTYTHTHTHTPLYTMSMVGHWPRSQGLLSDGVIELVSRSGGCLIVSDRQ